MKMRIKRIICEMAYWVGYCCGYVDGTIEKIRRRLFKD